jgi:metal-responsive CopG/Arc/MetJ family transcriptional regulator
MDRTAKIAISLPGSVLQKLERARRSLGKSRSAVIREAIEHWLRCSEIDPAEQQYIQGYLRHPEQTEQTAAVAASVIAGWEEWE